MYRSVGKYKYVRNALFYEFIHQILNVCHMPNIMLVIKGTTQFLPSESMTGKKIIAIFIMIEIDSNRHSTVWMHIKKLNLVYNKMNATN